MLALDQVCWKSLHVGGRAAATIKASSYLICKTAVIIKIAKHGDIPTRTAIVVTEAHQMNSLYCRIWQSYITGKNQSAVALEPLRSTCSPNVPTHEAKLWASLWYNANDNT